jgi:hypothetical protein
MIRICGPALLLALLALSLPACADPGFPKGWGGGTARPQDYEFGTAPTEGASGKNAAYIKGRPGAAANAFFSMLQCIRADDYIGKRMRLAARLKTVDSSGEQLFMRVDGPTGANGELGKVLGFYNMGDRPIRGTTDWKTYSVVLDVPQGAAKICFGFILVGGKGEAWADDFSLDAVGKDVPLSTLPPRAPFNLSFNQ